MNRKPLTITRIDKMLEMFSNEYKKTFDPEAWDSFFILAKLFINFIDDHKNDDLL